MSVIDIRFRKESFGYILAFASGDIGFYSDAVAPLLLQGTTQELLEVHRLQKLPIHEKFHLAGPLIVWFEITRSCNLPCKHCYVEAGKPRDGELTTPEIFSVLEQLKAQGVFALVLVGGEPMLHPDFTDILNYAHNLGFVISIATNGTHITQDIINKLPKEECVVSVSLDGTFFHEELRVKSTFEDLCKNLFLLKENNIPTALMTTLADRNVHELEDILKFAQENNFYFGVTPFSPIGRGQLFPQYLPGEKDVERASHLYVKDLLHEAKMMENNGLCVTKFLVECYNLSKASGREFCGVALAYILSDGSVFPCSVCASTGKFPSGNLRETDFGELWENSFQDIRKITFDDFKGCGTCELSQDPYFCTSRCPVMSEIYTGDPLQCGSTPYLKASLKRKTELMEEYSIRH
jgi:AdoMet-dependent heme synthase